MPLEEIGTNLSNSRLLHDDWDMRCPENYYLNPSYKDAIPRGTGITTILSSFFSILGSLLIIITFVAYKEVRTVGRAILVFLAIADFFTAVGYIFGAGVFLRYQPTENETNYSATYLRLCEAQSFITTVFPISSFLWTTNLAVYFFVAIVLRKIQFVKKLFVVFHITGWGIPLLICIPALAAGVLGPSGSHSSASWCWIRFDQNKPEELTKFYWLEVVCGKFWEIMTYFVALLLCLIVKYTIFKRNRRIMSEGESTYGISSIEKKMKAAFYNVDQTLIWIPAVFLIVRIWGTLRFFISLLPSCHYVCDDEVVVLPGCRTFLYNPWLVYLQSIGDPGQGWSNALLFVIFHRPIARRLFPCCFLCWERYSQWFMNCARRLVICRIRRKPVVETPPSSTHCTPTNSKDSQYCDQDPLIRKKKSGSKTSCDGNSVLYYSTEGGLNPSIIMPDDNVSINEQMDSMD